MNNNRFIALPKIVLSCVIDCYRYFISPLLGSNCRYYPSCSSYIRLSVMRFGFVRGGWLGVCRIARCHPWHPGGVDLVPDKNHRI